MESWQDEIIKAQISQEIGVERSMENSDISVFLKSFKENLIGAVDRDSFDKSWSSDLQSKFPNGVWRTVNGAKVFINNGKVIAGLDGFNGEIDKFFADRSGGGYVATKENESEGKLSEREQGLLDAYNKDKKAFLKQNIESAMLNPKAALENIDNLLSGSTTKEYKDMLTEAKKSLEAKIAEPKNTMNYFKEVENKLKRFVGENEGEIDLDKFLQGDVVENFKEYKAYETAAKKAEKAGNAVMWGEMIQMPLIEGKEVKLPKKDIKVKVSKTIEDAISGVLSKDELRPIFHGVYSDPDGYKVATDANALIAVKTDVGENSGKILNPKTGDEIEGKFPNWKVIVPERFDGEKEFKLSDIHSVSKQANDIRKQNPTSYMKLDGIPHYFFPEIMNKTVESLRKLGVEGVTIGYSDHEGKAILIKGKTNKGEDVQALVMPTMVKDESEVLTLK